LSAPLRLIFAKAPLDAATLDAAARAVNEGGTLIFPTDTVYGIGCDPEDTTAIERIFEAKGREPDKPLAIHLAAAADAERFGDLTASAVAVIERLWPGAVAIVVPRKPGACDAAARGGPTVSMRCPDSPECAAILRAAGPLAATSANRSGMPAFTGRRDELDRLVVASLAIITGPTSRGRESTVVDCTAHPIRILREGALDRQAIERALVGTGVEIAP